jgi:hypothetical protein
MPFDTPSLIRALPLQDLNYRLHLNAFRREPAIAIFDELFTPKHRSSEDFAASTRSALQHTFVYLQPAHV